MQEIVQANIVKERYSPETACFRGFLYYEFTLRQYKITQNFTVTNT